MARKAKQMPQAQAGPAFRAFADEAAVETFGDFSFENGSTRIALSKR